MTTIIGITSSYSEISEFPEEAIATIYSPSSFVESIARTPAIPVIIPFQTGKLASDYIHLIDGLILTGGSDISTDLYGEEPHPMLGKTHRARDLWEIELLKEAYQQEIPVLGICRGMQLMNVVGGGSLYQDLSSQREQLIQHIQKANFQTPSHAIKIMPDSWLASLYGKETRVNSYHHQSIKKLSGDFKIVAHSSDHVIEAIEGNNAYGVQWHPELLSQQPYLGQKIFDLFVQKASGKL